MVKARKSKSGNRRKVPLATLRPMVGGIDIGSTEHWVCMPTGEDGEEVEIRSFGTTTTQLEALVDTLAERRVRSVAMESTSVYWIPLYELLEERGIEPVLVNARQLQNVPGRKTDIHDCQWIQTLHSHGLLRGSFRPADAIVRLRSLHRQQTNFIQERTRCVQWMQKSLDQMNVQVHRAVTDLTGDTGMAIIRAIVAGERDPARLAAHRHHRCGKSEAQIAEHLRGNWREDHLFNLQSALRIYDSLQTAIADYDRQLLVQLHALQAPERQDQEVPRHPNPAKERSIRGKGHQEARTTFWRFSGVDLSRIDGIGAGAALAILTEIGPNLAAFPDEKHFVSWLRLCPRTPISGGKPLKKRRNGLGANRIAGVLRLAAVALQRSKSALGAEFRRIARHKSGAVAVFAIARKLAQLVYRMLRHGQDYVDIGEEAYEQRSRTRRLAGLNAAAKSLGYTLVQDAQAVAAN
jgi:transposase